MMGDLIGSMLIRRSALTLGGALVLAALGAAPGFALTGLTTSTNPASSALGPVSKQARPGTGASGTSASGLGSTTRNSGAVVGGTGAPGAAAGTGAGAAAGTGTPTITYAPPATSQPGTPAKAVPSSTTSTSATARHAPRRASSSTSAAAIALAIIALLLALAAAAWGIARSQAYEPRWTVSLRHAMAEAGFRASSTWSEFTDWVRLGR
jgi:hypothetical protein